MATDAGYEIRCNRCGAAVASTAETCPACGTVLLGDPPTLATEEDVADTSAAALAAASIRTPAIAAGPQPIRHGFGGFWIRALAWFCDSFIASVVVFAAVKAMGPLGALFLLPFLLMYQPVMESSAWQGTVGKKICGLAVTDLRGRRISVLRALVRTLAKILSALLFGVGFLMVAFTERKRGLHDVIAGTLVEWRPWGG